MAPLVFLVLTLSFVRMQPNEYKCETWSREHILNQTERHFFNITSVFVIFDKLSDLTNLKSCPNIRYSLETLKIYANEEFLLTLNTLDLSNFLSMFNFVDKKRKTLLFQNVKGFNFDMETRETLSSYLSSFDLNFFNIKFDLYINQRLITESECQISKTKMFEHQFNRVDGGKSFFGPMTSLILNDNVFYNSKICPYAFTNTNLEQVGLMGITNSFLFRNNFEFVSINETQTSFDLNVTSLIFLKLNVAYTRVTLGQVDKHVFKKMQVMLLSGIIEEIQNDLFAYFKVCMR